MKKEWTMTKWGDIATLEYGKRLTGYKDGKANYPVFGTNGQVGWTDDFISDGPGIIIGRKGAYRGVHYSTGPFSVIDTAFYLNPKTDFLLRWAYYYLSNIDINAMDSGSAIPSTSRGDFYNLDVLLPPLPTQERIADILGTLDDKIELNRQMNRTLEAMARAIFKSWFVDFDPVYAKMEGRDYSLPAEVMALFPDELVESELGMIPKGWEVKPLDKIAKYLNGYAMQKYPPEEGEDSLPVIKIRELRAGATDENSNRARLDIPEKYVITDGDVLFSWSGSLLVTIWTGGKGALNQHLFKVTSKKYPKWFYYLWTDHHLREFQRIAADKATTMGHIKRSHLGQALTVVPDEKVMIEGKKILTPIIENIITNSLESRTIEEMRDKLLPKLMSGEIEA